MNEIMWRKEARIDSGFHDLKHLTCNSFAIPVESHDFCFKGRGFTMFENKLLGIYQAIFRIKSFGEKFRIFRVLQNLLPISHRTIYFCLVFFQKCTF